MTIFYRNKKLGFTDRSKRRQLCRLLLIAFPAMINLQCKTEASKTTAELQKCIDLLREATKVAPTIFVKVHAAEALVINKYPEGIEETFTALQNAAPENFLGATRVLARLHEDDPTKYSRDIELIVDKFLHGDSSRQRLIALESLGKLGYSEPLPEIVQLADTGQQGFKAMARWVLANSGKEEQERRLAELLLSTEVTEYRTAAYAIRFFASIRPASYDALKKAVQQLEKDAAGRVYVISSLFVHTPASENEKIKAELLTYATGEIPERYETAEGLSLAGKLVDLPVLEKLLNDPDLDVRVAAANAIIKIEKRNK